MMLSKDAAPALRWGIIGTGAISRQMASDFGLVDGAELVAVSSRSAASAADFASEFGIPERFDDFQNLLRADIDAVYIGTPHTTHFAIASAALAAGRHVLCEKPLAMSAAEVRKLGVLAAEAGVFLMEAMWMKFNPLYVRLAELVRAGELGDVRSVQASFGIPFPVDGSSRWKPGGSALLDQGIYPVTLAHLFLGTPNAVAAGGVVREDGVDLAEHFTLTYADGAFAHGASSMTEWLDLSASICGTRAWVTIDGGFWGASKMTVHRPSMMGEKHEIIELVREGHGYAPMLRAVVEAIGDGRTEHPLHTINDTAAAFDTMDSIRARVLAAE